MKITLHTDGNCNVDLNDTVAILAGIRDVLIVEFEYDEATVCVNTGNIVITAGDDQ